MICPKVLLDNTYRSIDVLNRQQSRTRLPSNNRLEPARGLRRGQRRQAQYSCKRATRQTGEYVQYVLGLLACLLAPVARTFFVRATENHYDVAFSHLHHKDSFVHSFIRSFVHSFLPIKTTSSKTYSFRFDTMP